MRRTINDVSRSGGQAKSGFVAAADNIAMPAKGGHDLAIQKRRETGMLLSRSGHRAIEKS
jgi:hypothetical protein